MKSGDDDPSTELERLRARNKKLAEDKAWYQLILRLMELLNPLPGLEDMVQSLLANIVECIGGTNIKLYYWIGEDLHYQDFFGEKKRVRAIDDPDVAQVVETHAFVERRGGAEDALLKDGMLRGSYTWAFPLLVGQELIGVIKLENLHIHGASLGKYLPTFCSHAALILGNEIRNTIQRRAEEALKIATERLQLATEAGLIGIWDWDIERDELVWDESMYRLYGRRKGDFGGAYEAWISAVHPDDKALADGEIQAALRGEREYAPEFRVVWPDGSVHHIKAASRTVRDESGKPRRMVGINYDLTERKHAEEVQRRLNRELRAISDCNEALMRAEDEQTLLDDVCRIICEEAGYRMAWVGYAEHDEAKTIRSVAWAGIEEGYLAAAELTWADTALGRGPSGTAIRTGVSAGFADFASDPLAEPWRKNALQRGYRSSIALPLKGQGATTFGVLCIYAAEPGAFVPGEVRLLEELAGDLAFGITALRTRAERIRAETELRQSEDRYRMVFENSPVSLWEEDFSAVKVLLDDLKSQGITEIAGYLDQHPEITRQCVALVKVTDINQAALALHAASSKEELLAGLAGTFTPESFEVFRQELVCLGQGGTAMTTDAVVKTLAGELRNVTVCFAVCPGYQDTLSKVLVSLGDITERKRAEAEIRKLNEELEQRVVERTTQLAAANKDLEAFCYSVSHDLRAPLRHVDGFVQLLRRRIEGIADDQVRHYMDTIAGEAGRMGQLIDDLLTFSRMARNEMSRQRVDLAALAHDVTEELAPEAKDRKVCWRLGALPVVTGDFAMLHIVFVNLMANALKFTSRRDEAVIEIGCEERDREIVVFVRDNGVGFDMHHADKLFGVFQRLHAASDFEGTGIGLANVHRIVSRHGGRTWAEGRVDEGATFFFSLPRTRL